MTLPIELEREDDGRRIAEVADLAGVLTWGRTRAARAPDSRVVEGTAMGRSWVRILLVSTSLGGATGCGGMGPPGSMFDVGDSYQLLWTSVAAYDCDPTRADPRDDEWCGGVTGLETIRTDTVSATIRLDVYRPVLLCESDGCRETSDGTFAIYVTGAAWTCAREQASGPLACASPTEVVGNGTLSVTHYWCVLDDRRRTPSLPGYCEGHEGREILYVTFTLPNGLDGIGIEESGQLRQAPGLLLLALDVRTQIDVNWTLR
jgi:hypothetical protein